VNTALDLIDLQNTLYRSKNPTRRWLHCSRREWITSAVRKCRVPANDDALEIGPGSGVYLPILASRFKRVHASDIEKAYLGHANVHQRTLSNLHLVLDDICNSNLPSGSFDLILCSEVIEHIADSDGALRSMRRLLRPGGVLILSTPQRYSPLEITAKIAFLPGIISVVRKIYGEPILKTGHINLMTSRTVVQQLGGAGFSIEDQYQSGVYLPLLAELGGNRALQIEQWLESKLRGTFAQGLLWTQYYIARAV
jgi:SAM-dependent methyltransferase